MLQVNKVVGPIVQVTQIFCVQIVHNVLVKPNYRVYSKATSIVCTY